MRLLALMSLSHPQLPSLALVPFDTRVDTWFAPDVSRWANQMALACSSAGAPIHEPIFDILPSGKTPEEAYLRASSPSFWRRKGTRILRIAQESKELASGSIGGSSCLRYSGSSSGRWSEHKRKATASFLSNSVLYDDKSRKSVSLADLAKTPEHQAARYYAFLKGIEALAMEAGLNWAMLTITLPSEYHANPLTKKRSHIWNGLTPDQSHKVIADGWKRIRAGLLKHGITLSGVRTEEPMQDGTPHWHCAFFFDSSKSFDHICRSVLRQFPAGLRIRRASPTSTRRLSFSSIQYRSLADFDAGSFHLNIKEGAQCQLDVGAAHSSASEGVSSFASYVLKYVSKTLGVSYSDSSAVPPSDSDSESIIDSGPAAQVKRHRETYGIRAIEFFGIPKGAATCWDLLRRVELEPTPGSLHLAPPPSIARLAAICQQDKGSGIVEYLRLLGGLSAAPVPALFSVKPSKDSVTTRFRGQSVRLVGINLTDSMGNVESHRVVTGGKQILSLEAASALASASSIGTVMPVLDAPAAEGRGLVQIGTVVTASKAQDSAITASVHSSHTILAAAGSGKTAVLIGRAKFLCSQGIRPSDIVITTFTREAAHTLSIRLASEGLTSVQVGTMHSLSARWLSAVGCTDFDLSTVIELSTALAQADKHILLDEAQDLSDAQWAWARAHAKTLFSVGDFRQSIYGWRGVDKSAFRAQSLLSSYQSDLFKPGGVMELSLNFRSASAIVALANALSPQTTPSSASFSGGEVSTLQVSSLAEEAVELACWAKTYSGSKAILARTNAEVAYLRAELTLAGLSDVAVLTVHGAKGLEFDHVAFACGLRKPSESSSDSLEVTYVAVTRARHSLFITSVGDFPPVLKSALAFCASASSC